MDGPDVVITRGRIRGGNLPLGEVAVRKIKQGAFTKVYLDATTDTVYLVVPADCEDKEILREAWNRRPEVRPYLPELTVVGYTRTSDKVYSTNRLVPVTGDNLKLVTRINKRLEVFRKAVNPKEYAAYGYSMSFAFMEGIGDLNLPAALVEALQAVVGAAADFGPEHGLELAPRNWMQDPETGHLVMVDPTFNGTTLRKQRGLA